MASLAIASIVVSAVGAGVSYYGSQQQAKATERVAAYNAKVQENEAIQQDMEMREQISRQRRENKRLLASQRAGVAASGIELTGSPLEVLGANAANLELRNQDMARQATLGVMRGQSQAKATIWEGAQQAKGIRTQAAGTLLSDAGKLAWSTYTTGQGQGWWK